MVVWSDGCTVLEGEDDLSPLKQEGEGDCGDGEAEAASAENTPQGKRSKSDKIAADANALEQRLAKQPERSRLEAKGTIKDKATHDMQKLGHKHAKKNLENAFETRPAADEIKSADGFPMIKDLETHQEQQQQIGAATKLQAVTRGNQARSGVESDKCGSEDGDEPVSPSRKKLSPIPRKDLDGRTAWIFEQIDADTSGDLQRAEVVDFFGGASTSMLNKLKPNADGKITIAEWNKFIKGIKKERGESVLEGFLTFCEEIISKKGSGDAAGELYNL